MPSSIGPGEQTFTPPTVSTMRSKPAKSIPTKCPIFRPDIFWMTFTRHLGPPSAYVALSLSPLAAGRFRWCTAGVVVPALADRTFDVEVTREGDGDDTASVGGNVHQHDRVGARAFGVFDGSGADLTARARAGIGADDQVCLVAELAPGVDDVVGLGVECRNLIETAFDRPQITPDDAGQRERHDGQERYCRSADHFCAMAAANLALRQTRSAGVTDYPRHCGGDGMFFGDPVRSGRRDGRTRGNRPGRGRRGR